MRKIVCKNCGAVVLMNNIGRPRGNYPIQKVLNDYKRLQNINAVAVENKLSTGTVWRILKRKGVKIFNAKSTT